MSGTLDGPFPSATPTANGTVVLSGNGQVVYTPNTNFNGTDSFTVVVDDGALALDDGGVVVGDAVLVAGLRRGARLHAAQPVRRAGADLLAVHRPLRHAVRAGRRRHHGAARVHP